MTPPKRKPLDFDRIRDAAVGHWVSHIFPAVGIQFKGDGKRHQPCPVCGGNDRFRCDDKEGRGTSFCNQCGARNGEQLVADFLGLDSYDTMATVAEILHIDAVPAPNLAERQKLMAERQARYAQQQRQAEQAKNNERVRASSTAQSEWQIARDTSEHPYLQRKQVRSHGLRVLDDKLIIPLYHHDVSNGKVIMMNRQLISADGTKLFIKGGKKNETFFTLGNPSDDDVIFIAEGYATCASIYEALECKHPVIMTIDAGNMIKCASIVRALYPNSTLIFAADDDHATSIKTGKNTGIEAGIEAATIADGHVISPAFYDDSRRIAGELTDFNDLHVHYGIDEVANQLQYALATIASTASTDDISDTDEVPPIDEVAPAVVPSNTRTPAVSEQLKTALKQYAKIINDGKMTNKVFDINGKMQYTKTQFEHQVGKAVAKEWFNHDTLIIEQATADKQRLARSEQGKSLIERFALIFGTKEVWDNQLNTRHHAETIRMAYPTEFDYWLKSPERATLMQHNIWFDPSDTKRPTDIKNPRKGIDYVNSFNGLPISPLSDDELNGRDAHDIAKPLLDILMHLCDYDEVAFVWVMRWLAIPLQRLGTKMDTALILHGHMQGAGKSLFFDRVMRAIYGQYAVILGQGQLEQDYNEWIVDKMYGCFEEVFTGKDRYSNMGKVKQLITSEQIYIVKKYSNGWTQDNFVNMTFLSNDIMPLALEQNDRRFMVINPKKQVPDSIRLLVSDALKDPEQFVIRAFLSVLLNYDLGDQNAHTHPPMTQAKKQLINVSMASWERFFNEWQAGFLPVSCQTITTHELYMLYKIYCVRNGETATGKNKFAAYINAQENIKTERMWYIFPTNSTLRKQATWVIIGELGTKNGSRERWLGSQYGKFRSDLERSDWYD